ncbi:MAG: AraC family transcriptional regulator [bacterium]
MKLNYQHLKSPNNSINAFWVRANEFGVHWHYHPEIEICYVKKGEGHRIVGNSVAPFSEGDLVLLGSNLPHCWISNTSFNQSDEEMEVFVVHIDPNLFSNLNVEFSELNSLLETAKQGIHFQKYNSELINALVTLNNCSKIELYGHLHLLLAKMIQHKDFIKLSTTKPSNLANKKQQKDINAIVSYIQENFKDKITLSELAKIQDRNITSFCRYFKKQIGQTPFEYINELRVNDACHNLITTDAKIYQIAFDSGFNSLTHFNKIFKRLKNSTPLAFRTKFS